MIHVLLVCLGNICRSPMAEAIFRQKVVDLSLDKKIAVDSAGTANWHEGKVPHEGTRNKLTENHIACDQMFARQITEKDVELHDYIIVMDEQNFTDLHNRFTFPSSVTVKKMLDYCTDIADVDVPDPYYTGDFQQTYELLTNACTKLLDEIINEYQLKKGD